jgi:hypothetical protein
MLTTIMKYVAIPALLVGLFWHRSADLHLYLDFAICGAAAFVMVQAFNLRKYVWSAAFFAIACVFNPVLPLRVSFGPSAGLQVVSAAFFIMSLQMLRTSPRMTIASITEANPKTESL